MQSHPTYGTVARKFKNLVIDCLINNNNNNNNNNGDDDDDNPIERRNSRFLQSPTRTLKWPGRNPVQITFNTSSAYHVQPAVCHLVRRDSSAFKFDRVELSFIFALFYWLKPLTDEGGEETGVPGENP